MYNHVLTMRVNTEKILIIHNLRDTSPCAINMLKKVGGLLAPYIPTCTFAAGQKSVLVLLLLWGNAWDNTWGIPKGSPNMSGLHNQAT